MPTEVISTPLTGTWTVPNGVTQIVVECIGGGGAGGGASGNPAAGSGGAGGCYAKKTMDVLPGTVLDYSIGASKTGTTTGLQDNNTGNTTFMAEGRNAFVRALGGQGGAPQNLNSVNQTVVGVGATSDSLGNSCTGDVVFAGGSGSAGLFASGSRSGGGGGGAYLAAGNNAVTGVGGAAQGTYGGAGGTGPTTGAVGVAGSNYGGGGSGAHALAANPDRAGGSGAQGVIIITYTVTPPRKVYYIQ